MTHLQKLRSLTVLKGVSLDFTENNFILSKTNIWATGSYHIAHNPRFYVTKRTVKPESGQNIDEELTIDCRMSRSVWRQARAALLEYLHSTRSLQYMDAEFISQNSPHFLEKLWKRVETESDVASSMTRFLRYHPINEFEPFFESMGLKPSEYSSLLPRDLMFLNDDEMLLVNYHVLCAYGIPRNKIGMIYTRATEVFTYGYGVLQSKLESFEKMGLNQATIIKVVTSSPYLLTGNVSREFHEVLEKLKSIGIECEWVEGHLLEGNLYNWSHMLEVLCIFNKMGYSNDQLGDFISQHPGLLFEYSGNLTLSLIVFLLKFGSKVEEMHSVFLNFPQIEVGKFVSNLIHCCQFLIELKMDAQNIGKIVCSHPVLLGSCSLKKVNSILSNLNAGKKRVCEIIKENPFVLNNWVLGSRVKPLLNSRKDQNLGRELSSQIMKTKFLLDLGFVEDSSEMKKALKVFRGNGVELQERFDCLANAGLNRKDIIKMLKVAPHILSQSKDMIEMKINFLVNSLGFPLSTLVSFPSYLSYTTQRVKLRYSMYNWLREEGRVDPKLAICTIISCSDKVFISRYVNLHHKGPEIWEKLNEEIYSD